MNRVESCPALAATGTEFNAARFDELEYDLTTLAERSSQEATRDAAYERLPVSDCFGGRGAMTWVSRPAELHR
jgi:hypothetical protein